MNILKFSASKYQRKYIGLDGINVLNLENNETCEVSNEKKAQLLADFPNNFESVAKLAPTKAQLAQAEADKAEAEAKAKNKK